MSRMIQKQQEFMQGYFFLVVFTLATILTTVSCGQKDQSYGANGGATSNGGSVVALAPLSNACATGSVNQSQWDPRYQQYGVIPYAQSQGMTAQGFCGCPSGYQPMCDNSAGVACMPTRYLGQQMGGRQIAWWRLGQNGLAFHNYSGYAGYSQGRDPAYNHQVRGQASGYPHGYASGQVYHQSINQNSCATQMGNFCQVGTNSCGGGSLCHPLSAGSQVSGDPSIGVCGQ